MPTEKQLFSLSVYLPPPPFPHFIPCASDVGCLTLRRCCWRNVSSVELAGDGSRPSESSVRFAITRPHLFVQSCSAGSNWAWAIGTPLCWRDTSSTVELHLLLFGAIPPWRREATLRNVCLSHPCFVGMCYASWNWRLISRRRYSVTELTDCWLLTLPLCISECTTY